MTEPIRNLLGFMIVPSAIGCVWLLGNSLYWRRLPTFRHTIRLLGSMAFFGFLVFAFAEFIEAPIAYCFTLLRMPGAKSVNGLTVSQIIKDDGVRWVTDDYFSDKCGDYSFLTTIRLETRTNKSDYYFAYDSRTRVLVPMTDATAQLFPAFMPPDDELVNLFELNSNQHSTSAFNGAYYMGNNMLKLPAKWFHSSVCPEPVRKSKN